MNKGIICILQIQELLLFHVEVLIDFCKKLRSPHIWVVNIFFSYIVSVKNRIRKDSLIHSASFFSCVHPETFLGLLLHDFDVHLCYGDNFQNHQEDIHWHGGIRKDSYSMLSNLWLLLHLINCGARSSLRNLFQIQYLKHCFEFFSMSLIWVLAFCLLPSPQIWKGTSQIRIKYLLM